MNHDKEIAYTEDIAGEVARELGMSEEKIMYHINFMVHWIKTLTKRPTIQNIYIPHIGSLFLNWSKVQSDYDKFSSLPKAKHRNGWEKRLNDDEIRLEEFKLKFEGEEGYIRHKKRTKITSPFFNKGKSLQELEEWQNK